MIFLLLLPVYLLAVIYILYRFFKWAGTVHSFLGSCFFRIPFGVCFFIAAVSPALSFLLPAGSAVQRFFKSVNNYWTGYLLYIVLFLGAGELIRLILRLTKVSKTAFYQSGKTFLFAGLAVIVLVVTVGTYGIFHAGDIRINRYEIAVDKKRDLSRLHVVLVADLHLGYSVGVDRMRQMVKKINELDPDLVCIAGDIFDNDYDALDDPEELISILKGIKSTYGVYSCYGNHDVTENLLMGFAMDSSADRLIDPRMEEFLERAGICSMKDETLLVDDAFYLVSRLDYSRPGNGQKSRKTIEELTEGLDLTRPVLVMDHQPKNLELLEEAGVDVALSGHTHDGQLFPGNLITGLMWENSHGYLRKGSLHSFVTSGVGVWGPNMRVGTDSEIMDIHITFEQ